MAPGPQTPKVPGSIPGWRSSLEIKQKAVFLPLLKDREVKCFSTGNAISRLCANSLHIEFQANYATFRGTSFWMDPEMLAQFRSSPMRPAQTMGAVHPPLAAACYESHSQQEQPAEDTPVQSTQCKMHLCLGCWCNVHNPMPHALRQRAWRKCTTHFRH